MCPRHCGEGTGGRAADDGTLSDAFRMFSSALSTADVMLLEQIMYKYKCINVVSFICICSSRQWTKKLHK